MYLWYKFYLRTHNDTNPSIMLASLHDNEQHPLETVPTTEQKNIEVSFNELKYKANS